MITYLPEELIITILQLSIGSKNDLLNLSLTCIQFNKLKFLSIKKICFKQYPNIKDSHVSKLKNLTSLDLSYNNVITSDGIKHLINLTRLDLRCNNLITDDGIKHLVNLTFLDLSYNKIITNDGIKHLVNLTSLNLSYNKIITDDGIKHLVNLK